MLVSDTNNFTSRLRNYFHALFCRKTFVQLFPTQEIVSVLTIRMLGCCGITEVGACHARHRRLHGDGAERSYFERHRRQFSVLCRVTSMTLSLPIELWSAVSYYRPLFQQGRGHLAGYLTLTRHDADKSYVSTLKVLLPAALLVGHFIIVERYCVYKACKKEGPLSSRRTAKQRCKRQHTDLP